MSHSGHTGTGTGTGTISTFPSLGTRISLSGYVGTIRYVGEVHGTSGIWFGVEWDDPSRGKHDGIKGGKRYFSCLSTSAGSFIRPLPSVQYGKTFLSALIDKYVEQFHGSDTQETVILGSSNGAIQVEAVNLDKIRGKFSDLERLREISLDKENVSGADPPGEIRKKCPNVKGLDLSYSLISSWDVIALIAIELPSLERLGLNNNRLRPLSNMKLRTNAFLHLTELQLNGTLMAWQAIVDIVALVPNLKHLEAGYNRLQSLTLHYPGPMKLAPTIINLDCNQLSDWAETCQALLPFQKLDRLILSSNSFKSIPFPTESHDPLGLTHLSLSSTGISEWSSIDSLNLWCPQLESLSLNRTPLLTDSQMSRVWQQIVIARLPRLRTLDGTSISQRQRIDAELFYLSRIARESYSSDAARGADHPRWVELCEAHGTPDITSVTKDEDNKLKNHLIEIKASLSAVSPPPSAPEALKLTKPVKVLPSAPLRILRLKLLKLFKSPRGAECDLWIRMADGNLTPLGDIAAADDDKEIDWWLENGSEVVIYVKE
ncbi:hypothetical protein B0F90DRAFT_1623181 [Multifurca ochricompacta]|uniref:CAP-Gly domain-containing protein n=1 Tax=Multifurca ochricompacta TaxID=376703 RepID=A0AAD4QQJ3_9AGAM|nr:hypothetical protein B0F90DRAFT_1623181 [Multifurca ochricompacta]